MGTPPPFGLIVYILCSAGSGRWFYKTGLAWGTLHEGYPAGSLSFHAYHDQTTYMLSHCIL